MNNTSLICQATDLHVNTKCLDFWTQVNKKFSTQGPLTFFLKLSTTDRCLQFFDVQMLLNFLMSSEDLFTHGVNNSLCEFIDYHKATLNNKKGVNQYHQPANDCTQTNNRPVTGVPCLTDYSSYSITNKGRYPNEASAPHRQCLFRSLKNVEEA